MSVRKELKQSLKLKRTKSSKFLLPIYGFDINEYGEYFIDAYIKEFEDDKSIVIVFENSENEDLCLLLYKLQNHHWYKNKWVSDESRELCVEMVIPNIYEKDFDRFKVGDYSKLSGKLKELLIRNYGSSSGTGKDIMMYDALFPSEKKIREVAKDLEVEVSLIKQIGEILSSPYLEDEVYRSIEDYVDHYSIKDLKEEDETGGKVHE